MPMKTVPPLIETLPIPGKDTAEIRFNFHKGQRAALNSPKRIVLILAGSRSGKTAAGPPWLWREMRWRGPGDYRLAIDRGRVLLTTTPYTTAHWLKTRIYDPWKTANKNHSEIDVFQFDSTWNPTFPPEEYERARRDLPGWKFSLFFKGLFEKPAGA